MTLRWLDVVRLRVRSLFRRGRVEAELDRELRAHLEDQVAEHMRRGMSPDEARRAAVHEFGGFEQVKEEAREARGVARVENLGRDLRHTLRGLLREPMLLIAATLSIALGAGGNIAVFSLARAFLFATPDVRRPAEMVQIRVNHSSHVSYDRWRELDASGALGEVAGYSIERQVNWFNGDAAVSITPMLVTANFFDVTGVPLARGRAFTTDEARAERDPHLVVISHRFWQRELGGDAAVVGRPLILDGESYTILGILAPKLRSVAGLTVAPSLYVALNRSLTPEIAAPQTSVVQLIGRLKPGQTLAQGRSALDVSDRQIGRLQGDTVNAGVQLFSPLGAIEGKAGRTLGGFFLLLSLVSVFVLLIACANVAGLLIARGTARRRETAIRLAIGGTRARLVQQFLVEGFWLALFGTVAGLGLGVAFMRVANGITLPVPLPVELQLAPDVPVLLCAMAVVVLSMLLSALLPALKATRLSLTPALRREEPKGDGRRFNTRSVLLVGQVTVSTVLLVTALLFLRNLARTQLVSPGFEVQRELVVQLGFAQGQSASDNEALLQRAVERVQALPGVEEAAYANAVPLTIHNGSHNGRTARIGEPAQDVRIEYAESHVGPGYFAAMGIRLVAGRAFGASDVAGAPPVAVVNEEFVRRYLAGANPIGAHLRFTENRAPVDYEVVGVVSNSRHQTIGESQRAALYYPLLQHPEGLALAFVLVRAGGDPAALVGPVRQAVGELDRSMSVDVSPMRSALAFALLPSQVGAAVLGGLGVLGLVLAAFGLYAIVSYTVSRRIGEIAIRSALGATRGGIVRLVVRDASLLVGLGVVLGLGLAAFVTQPLAAYLVEGLSTTDPLSFAGTALVFVAVSVLASWLPARKATRISPVVAMRLE